MRSFLPFHFPLLPRCVTGALLVLALVGCEPDKPAPPAAAAALATQTPSSSAAAASAPAASARTVPLGPSAAPVARPANGILGAGQADGILKRGEPRRVTLVSAGAEPREAIGYRFVPGVKQTATLALELAMSMSPPGMQPKLVKMPRTESDLAITAEPGEGGAALIRVTLAGVRVTAEDASQAGAVSASGDALKKLQGLELALTVDPLGRRTEIALDKAGDRNEPAAAAALEQVRATLQNVLVPMPEEPVGVGARWVVVERIATPSDVIQIRTVELKKRDGTRVEVEIGIQQIAASDKLGNMPLGRGPQPTLSSLDTDGKATFAVDLERVCPDSGVSEVKTVMLLASGRDAMRTEAVARATIKSR